MKRQDIMLVMGFIILVIVQACNTQMPSVLPTPTPGITPQVSLTTLTPASPTIVEPSPTKTITQPLTETPISSPTIASTVTPCSLSVLESLSESIVFSAVKCVSRNCEPFDGDVAPIYSISGDGNNLQQIYTGTGVIGDLQLSPDGAHLAFTDNYGRGVSNVYILDLVSGHVWSLVPDSDFQKVWGATWVSDDRLVFIKTKGINSSNFHSDLYLANIDGTQLHQLTDRPLRTRIHSIAVSPDGARLLFAEYLPDSNATKTYYVDIDGIEMTELITFPENNKVDMVWSPAGDQAFIYPVSMATSEHASIYTTRVDGSEVEEIVSFPEGDYLDFKMWTKDQTGMVFYACNRALHTNQLIKIQRDGDTHILAMIDLPGIPVNTSPCSFGVLSHDQRVFALSPFYPFIGNDSLYVMDISTGCGYQILDGYRIESMIWYPTGIISHPKQSQE